MTLRNNREQLQKNLSNLRKAWRRIKRDTIRNCFRHRGFEESKETVEEEQDEETISFVKDAVKRGIISADSFEEYVSIDDEVLTSAFKTDKDIVREFQKENVNQVETDDEEDADPGVQNFITANEAAVALKTMQHILIQQDNASRSLSNLEEIDTFCRRILLKKIAAKINNRLF